MNEVGCTSGIGWPVSLKLFECGGNVYFDCQAVLDLCGIERQIKKHGFKFIDKFLLDNGEYYFALVTNDHSNNV